MESALQQQDQSMTKDGGEGTSEPSAAEETTERVIIYSRGEEQQWTQFDEQQKLASEEEGRENHEPTTSQAATSEAINQDDKTEDRGTAPDDATEKNANEQPEEAVESGDVINEANEAASVADANALDTAVAVAGSEMAQVSQTNAEDKGAVEEKGESGQIEEDNKKAPNGDDLKEKVGEGVLAWSKPADDVIEQAAGDKSEQALSQQFNSRESMEGSLAKGNLGDTSEDPGEMMKVVYGRDAPAEDDSAKDAPNPNTVSSKPDPQLNWEGRKSSANIRYVINEPQSQSEDSALVAQKDDAKINQVAASGEGSSNFISLQLFLN